MGEGLQNTAEWQLNMTHEIAVPESAIQIIDDDVLAKFPQGTKVKSISAHGASYRTRTAHLLTEQEDGTKRSFFLKPSMGQRGIEMLSSELVFMTAIYKATPDFAPELIAWGTYASDPEIHFFLCSFHEMSDELPNVQRFSAKLAELHRNGTLPNGKYGFCVTTLNRNLPQDNRWTDTWEEFYVQGMKRMLELEEEAQGPSADLQDLCVPFYEKVIPRLLRLLETGGRRIGPCPVHGDLWYGNASTDLST